MNLRKLELNNLKLVYQIMEEDNWEDIDFNLIVPNIEKYKSLEIDMFCLKHQIIVTRRNSLQLKKRIHN